jgi:hypothetical protein
MNSLSLSFSDVDHLLLLIFFDDFLVLLELFFLENDRVVVVVAILLLIEEWLSVELLLNEESRLDLSALLVFRCP